MLTGSSPILVADNIPETIRFYTEVLGFTSNWAYGDPPTFGAAIWGSHTMMFCYQPELVDKVDGHQHWFDVEDVNALHALHLERGAMIVSAIEDKPWGKREYTVRDPNGYHLRFTGNPSHESKGSGVFPEGVQILRRMPTGDEYQAIAGSAFYPDGAREDLLANSWGGVVAVNATGATIGMVRIMFDAPGWFSIWDVAVLPEWQGQRIGTAMMEAAMDLIRQEAPGAFVYLFTFKHGFYERMGFSKGDVQTIKV